MAVSFMKHTSLSEWHKVLHSYRMLRVSSSEIKKLLEVNLQTVYPGNTANCVLESIVMSWWRKEPYTKFVTACSVHGDLCSGQNSRGAQASSGSKECAEEQARTSPVVESI